MPTVRRWLALVALVFVISGASGCQLLNLLPTTTWKLNRGPALDEGSGYFSIPDPQISPAERSGVEE